jgi:CheY-like chemotaxis protein
MASQEFVAELRQVLHHLYNPVELRKSPLLDILVTKRANRLSALRQVLTDAIQALKPGSDAPPYSNAWRIYHVLVWRYLEQSSQRDVAANLAISPRQLRRLEHVAVQVLADHLWARYDLERAPDRIAAPFQAGGEPGQADVAASGRERELEWLGKSLPSEVVDISKVVQASLETIDPLLQQLGVQVECDIPEDLPLMIGQRVPLRQALLNVLSATVRTVPGGRMQIAVETEQRGLCVHVRATTDTPPSPAPNDEFAEKLNMAGQLIGLFGGTLEVMPVQDGEQIPAVTLVLSVARQVPVLMIDDNADTLQLFERYLSESRYRFIGARDPEQALNLAEELAPQVILLDVMLPGVDGWELLGRLREHPQTRGLPVLVCTILPQEQLALTLGAAAFIRKPVSRQTLLSALDRYADRPLRGSH